MAYGLANLKKNVKDTADRVVDKVVPNKYLPSTGGTGPGLAARADEAQRAAAKAQMAADAEAKRKAYWATASERARETQKKMARQKAEEAAKAEGEKLFADLGRYEKPDWLKAEEAAYLEKLKAAGQGYDAKEYQALRENAYEGLNRGLATDSRMLTGSQGSSGVRGPAASGQQMMLANKAQETRRGLERDILLAAAARKDQGLGALGAYLGGQGDADFRNEVFNIGQGNKEQFGKATYPIQKMGVYDTGETNDINADILAELLRENKNVDTYQPPSGGGEGDAWYRPWERWW